MNERCDIHSGGLRSFEGIDVLLHDALGITAWKKSGNAKWTLRANPSGGALQPLEAFVLGPIGDAEPSQWHYNPYWHCLGTLSPLPHAAWAELESMLPEGAIVLGSVCPVWFLLA